MGGLKAAIIGAGSSYTPELIEGFIERYNELEFKDFHLMDINEKRLDIVGGLAKRMFSGAGLNVKVTLTSDLTRAVDGADYVFGQIRVGGMAARILDEKIPLRHGLLGQETTGAGGFMNALRTVPVMMSLAKIMSKHAPDAWLINFSNPSGIIAEALLNHTNIKTIGLCNNAVNMLAAIEKTLGHKDFEYEYLGLNHLSWITSVTVNGKNLLSDLNTGAGAKMKNIPDVEYPDDLLQVISAIPCYYLSYYYLREQQLKKCLEAEKTRGEICAELDNSLFNKYGDPELSVKPKELESRGGALYSTAAVSVASAIENDKNEHHVVNVLNSNRAISFMETDDVVEVKALIGKNGAKPVSVTTYRPFISGLMQTVKAYEKLTVSAALFYSRTDALAALMAHPLVGDYDKAAAVLKDMLWANREYVRSF